MSDVRVIIHRKYTKISEILYVLFSNKSIRQDITAQLNLSTVMCKNLKAPLFTTQT